MKVLKVIGSILFKEQVELIYFSDIRFKNVNVHKTPQMKKLWYFHSNQSGMILRQEDLS